jgi:hypothetical protein
MSNNGLTKNYTAEGPIAAFTIVRAGAADKGALQASAVSDPILGISTEVDVVSGERVDVVHEGIADLRLGGTVARGAPITTNASGLGVAAAPAAGVNNRIVGVAVIGGVSGDIIKVIVSLSSLQG